MEEGLTHGGFTAVFGEVKTFASHAGRRLTLAARESGTTAFMLRGREAMDAPSGAATRWRVRSVPRASLAPQAPGWNEDEDGYAWRLDLLRSAGAMPRSWSVLWQPGRTACPFSIISEDWPKDHECENENGETGPPPGALSLASPLSSGTMPQRERPRRSFAG
jgi:hypothetical protein